jgi:hypothetical protein
MSDLEELDVVKATLRSVESSSDGFYLAPDVDEGLGASRSRDSGIFELGEHKIKFSA